MNTEKREEPGKGATPIKPAEIKLTGAGASDKKTRSTAGAKPRPLIWAGLFLLIGIALGVIFILPQWVKPAADISLKSAPASPAAATGPGTSAPASTAASPWDEAQQARLRKTSQELLEQLLEAQDLLEQKGVKHWAADQYEHAITLAKEGDAVYRQQQFQQANEFYGQALAALTNLIEAMETVFAETMEKGEQALTGGNSMRAGEAFELALLIKPDDPTALTGRQRARTLDQVLALIAKAGGFHQNGQLEEARNVYREVLGLDPETFQAKTELERVEREIRDRDFSKFMSAGYSALEKGRLAEARKSFEQALKLKPGAVEAASGLEQTVLRITNTQIHLHLGNAKEAEQNENWAGAVSNYDKALSLDGSLVPAREGRQYAAMRAALDEKLQSALDRPDRLTDKAVHTEAAALEAQARTITNPGPRLAQQIQTLASLLQLAATPVEVTLRSDNQTQVTLYKVGELGSFTDKQLVLLPGRYVAAGNRPGYRDVRVEFTVYTGKTIPPVVIQCEEKIALGK